MLSISELNKEIKELEGAVCSSVLNEFQHISLKIQLLKLKIEYIKTRYLLDKEK